MLIKVFSVLSMLLKLSKPPEVCWRGRGGGGGGGGGTTGLLNKGGGSNKLPGFVTEQQAVEFPQVYWLSFVIVMQNRIMTCNWRLC